MKKTRTVKMMVMMPGLANKKSNRLSLSSVNRSPIKGQVRSL